MEDLFPKGEDVIVKFQILGLSSAPLAGDLLLPKKPHLFFFLIIYGRLVVSFVYVVHGL